MIKVKALNQAEFEAVSPNGCVYGKYKGLYVYIELGREEEYISHPKDDPKTEYRLFKGCRIEYSETEDQVEQGIHQYDDDGVTVVVYW